ncbi:LLM class F420-dependent oxidoreductase [Micromonospora sp. BRA006-A]|nr:LLM class F420-dependent oxidoreductase [Micromonospora sp. BRA006-A]
MTVPLGGIPLADHAAVYAALDDAGFTDVWSSEVAGADAFTPLALAAAWSPRLRLGTAITPVFTRGPGLLAMSAAALAEAAPGRFALGVGASSPVLVRDWNAIGFDEPFKRTRDVLRFLRAALRGEDSRRRVRHVRRTTVHPGAPARRAAAGPAGRAAPGMLRLAAAEADGVILNWLAADDVPTALAEVGERRPGFDVAARIFVCPTDDTAYARALGRRMITGYLTVPAYAAFHRWLGRQDSLGPMWEAWAAGTGGASAAVPDEVVDALVLHGSPEQCVAAVRRYADNGVDVPVIAVLPTPEITEGGAAAWMDLLPRLAPEGGLR